MEPLKLTALIRLAALDKRQTAIALEDGRTQILWPDHCVQGSDGALLLLDEKLLY